MLLSWWANCWLYSQLKHASTVLFSSVMWSLLPLAFCFQDLDHFIQWKALMGRRKATRNYVLPETFTLSPCKLETCSCSLDEVKAALRELQRCLQAEGELFLQDPAERGLCYTPLHFGGKEWWPAYVCVFVQHVGACMASSLPHQSADPSAPFNAAAGTASSALQSHVQWMHLCLHVCKIFV